MDWSSIPQNPQSAGKYISIDTDDNGNVIETTELESIQSESIAFDAITSSSDQRISKNLVMQLQPEAASSNMAAKQKKAPTAQEPQEDVNMSRKRKTESDNHNPTRRRVVAGDKAEKNNNDDRENSGVQCRVGGLHRIGRGGRRQPERRHEGVSTMCRTRRGTKVRRLRTKNDTSFI
ncbi:hypothetical protein RF55_12662 [Lasius niger]|uniref:Uncharacterized protein n=1 Tax=Lasius niger TaxID=67767 RepID=A0A0J7KCJ2_LASNI|nr:hypothetical protein RF55_12662 [Lasius niger]